MVAAELNFMELPLKEIIAQVPALGVLCFVVWMFIKHLDRNAKMVAQMHEESMVERRESRIVIRENANATTVNTAALNNLAQVINSKVRT